MYTLYHPFNLLSIVSALIFCEHTLIFTLSSQKNAEWAGFLPHNARNAGRRIFCIIGRGEELIFSKNTALLRPKSRYWQKVFYISQKINKKTYIYMIIDIVNRPLQCYNIKLIKYYLYLKNNNIKKYKQER